MLVLTTFESMPVINSWELLTLSEDLGNSFSFQQSTPKHKEDLFHV